MPKAPARGAAAQPNTRSSESRTDGCQPSARVPNRKPTTVATITGRTVNSTLPMCDTPGVATANPGSPDGLSRAAAEAAWRAVTASIAATQHVRISRNGGRTYPARYVRPLPADPPGQPCTVPVYDPGAGSGRMLALDLDPSRGDVDHQAAELGQLLERIGARHVTDVAPSGGRHVLVLFSSLLPWRELRDLVRAMSLRFPAVDPAPMCSLGGQISPPGSRHKSGGWRVLTMPLSEARAAVGYPNGPQVWAALLGDLAAELEAVEQPCGEVGAPGSAPTSELDDTGAPWVPRLGGRAPLGPELERVARAGQWDGHATRAAARRAWPSWAPLQPAAGGWPRWSRRSPAEPGRAWLRCTRAPQSLVASSGSSPVRHYAPRASM